MQQLSARIVRMRRCTQTQRRIPRSLYALVVVMDSLKSDVLDDELVARTVSWSSDTQTSTSLGPLTQEARVETG